MNKYALQVQLCECSHSFSKWDLTSCPEMKKRQSCPIWGTTDYRKWRNLSRKRGHFTKCVHRCGEPSVGTRPNVGGASQATRASSPRQPGGLLIGGARHRLTLLRKGPTDPRVQICPESKLEFELYPDTQVSLQFSCELTQLSSSSYSHKKKF